MKKNPFRTKLSDALASLPAMKEAEENKGKKIDIVVIVSRCIWNAQEKTWQIWGERLFAEHCDSLDKAKEIGESKRAKGMSVLIRPNFNEYDEKGKYFREWRSFDDAEFKEARWDL